MSIKSYEQKGKIYYKVYVCLRSKSGKKFQRQVSGLKTRESAVREERKLISELTREIAKKDSSPVWGDLVDSWELYALSDKAKTLQRTTVTDRTSSLRNYTHIWWDMPVDQINRADVKEVFDLMEFEGRTVSLMKSIKAAVNCIFNWAIDFGVVKGIRKSPAEGYGLKKAVEKEPGILSLGEIKTLLNLAKEQRHPWYPVWSMALMTGMRSGELYAIRWADVDWEGKRLMVSKSYNGRLKIEKSTKAGYWREVPINDELISLLRKLQAESKGRKYVLPRLPRWQNGEAAKHLRMFCKGNGIPSVKFHDLRACFATQLIRHGIAPAIVMKICGWKDMKTMQRYIRLAGIEIEGATADLKIMPEAEVMGEVVKLFN